MKRIGIIGRGTAGCLAVTNFYFNNPNNLEIIWYYDDFLPTQSVGEATLSDFPAKLWSYFNFYPHHFKELDASYKYGIRKINWNGSKDFVHSFPLGTTGLHYNANKFQKFVFNFFQNKIKIVKYNVSNPNDLDCDYVIDCSGKPNNYSKYNLSPVIPVNSAYVVDCYWNKPQFNNSLHIARPYGWVFGIPLQNRCSIGYLYNKNINTLDEVKEDIKNIFLQFNLSPSENIQQINFNNYYRKQNFTDKVAYNGNASFFLEPMESTSLASVENINRMCWEYIHGKSDLSLINYTYKTKIKDIERVMALHYFAGSIFETKFWKTSYTKSKNFLEKSIYDPDFVKIYKMCKDMYLDNPSKKFPREKPIDLFSLTNLPSKGTWPIASYLQNFEGLDLYSKIDMNFNLN